jgi:hypothetical protein
MGADKLASRFLQAVVKYSPAESQPWGRAMLREMDFIDGPWNLLSWAIGSAFALFACSVRMQFRTGFDETLRHIRRSGSKRTVGGLLSGLGIATILLGLCVLSYFVLLHFWRWQLLYARLIDGALVFFVPEVAYAVGISMLWRRRRSAALGILLAAVILLTHVLVHHVTHS